MNRVTEPPSIVEEVARVAGISSTKTAALVRVFRDCVDELLADDHSVVAWPLLLGYPGDPVARRFADLLATATHAQLDAVALGDREAVAEWLGVDLGLVDRHPIAGEIMLLIRVLDRLGINERTEPEEAQSVHATLMAWLDTFTDGRRYRMSAVGLERHLEAWLVGNLDALDRVGYPVVLERQQWVLADRRRPDLVCRFSRAAAGATAGDWLVIELKAGSGYREAVDQLAGYVDAARDEVAGTGERVFGVLICDGASPTVRQLLADRGLGYRSLTSLGYREHLGAPQAGGPLAAVGDSAAPDHERRPACYTLSYGGRPALVLEADALTAPVVAVHPLSKMDLTPAMAVKGRELAGPHATVLDVAAALRLQWHQITVGEPPQLHTALDDHIYGATLDPAPGDATAPPVRATWTLFAADQPVLIIEVAHPDLVPHRIWWLAPDGLDTIAPGFATAISDRAPLLEQLDSLPGARLRRGDPISGINGADL